MALEAELQDEQRFLDRAYRGLEAMRRDANRMLESVLDLGRGGTFQSRTERDIVVRTSLARLAQLDVGDQALCFGRIDQLPPPGAGRGDSFHIGRLAVSGEDHEPLVVDWRAPVAEPFYRATGLDPQGLARRRHLAVHRRTVTGLEDEYFVDPAVAGGEATEVATNGTRPGEQLEDGMALGGPGALLAALGGARTGRMGDIVATIQREQDEIIRAPLAGVLMVQGGPGTGKTAVALHRAAYLLYTHRFPLERQGVLVVGPNPLFLRYIEQVLPSLGETGVTLSTVSGLVPEIRVRATEPAEVARLKGEARMARVIARAVRTRQRGLREDVVVPFGAATLRLTAADSAEVVAAARRRPGTHNSRRRFVEQQVTRRLADQFRRFRREMAGDTTPRPVPVEGGAERGEDEVDETELWRQVRRVRELASALDRMWPRLAPHELLHDLLGARPLLAAAGRGILSPAEQSLLHRPRSGSLDEVPWTPADAALVDEARTVLGPRRRRATAARGDQRERLDKVRDEVGFWPTGLDPTPAASTNGHAHLDEEAVRSFGHIVVDEVQDLSPMQLRMLARRSLSGSMTVVGDIAQATGPWSPLGWDDIARHLAPRRRPRLVELTVSYRTPAEVVAVAAPVLAAAAPGLSPPRPVRRSGIEPVEEPVGPGELVARVAHVAAREVAAVGEGRAAVLAPSSMLDELARGLADAGVVAVDPRDPRGAGLSAPLVLLPADEANGLEFDSVVIVEPARIAAGDQPLGEGPLSPTRRGLRTLYVDLTRPTRRLTVIRALPLPEPLAIG
ncbi:MAG: HelD family protein [Acidimicrobiales bacterium]